MTAVVMTTGLGEEAGGVCCRFWEVLKRGMMERRVSAGSDVASEMVVCVVLFIFCVLLSVPASMNAQELTTLANVTLAPTLASEE